MNQPPRSGRSSHPPTAHHHRTDLARIAGLAMIERGLEPAFPPAVLAQVTATLAPAVDADPTIADLRALPWCSIDNDDSRDLDQLTVCEPRADGRLRVLIAIADVDALVKKGSPVDDHARRNTTSVYTSAVVFPMLPERLSTDLTSLNPDEDRLALVTELIFASDGALEHSGVMRARVRNQAKLAYDAVSSWLVGEGPLPAAASQVPAMEQQLVLQDRMAQALRARRHAEGALEFETHQPRAVFEEDRVVGLEEQAHNRARQLIEEFMIAANRCNARFLAEHGGASLRRVVRSPERWLRIVSVAAERGIVLPPEPDSGALEAFLAGERLRDPIGFSDLSLVIIKLMGRGEYVVESPGASPIGHFGLAVTDYTHSTAPNRRFPDLITLRQVKALLTGGPAPYSVRELGALAEHCTRQEDAAQKVERRMRKSEAALLLESRIDEHFDAIVTGVTMAGIWVRLISPFVEGRLDDRVSGLRVGQRVRVRLVFTDVERGYIDFRLVRGNG
jgi:exoribonuclease-2